MTSTHWQNIALWTIDAITESLRGTRDANALRRLTDRLGDKLLELKKELRTLDAVRHAVSVYHATRPGNQHDRLDREIDEDCVHFVNRSHPKWTREDYAELQASYNAYIADHPLPGEKK